MLAVFRRSWPDMRTVDGARDVRGDERDGVLSALRDAVQLVGARQPQLDHVAHDARSARDGTAGVSIIEPPPVTRWGRPASPWRRASTALSKAQRIATPRSGSSSISERPACPLP